MKKFYLPCLLGSLIVPGDLLFSQPPGAEVAEELVYDYTDEGEAYYIQTIIHFSNLGTNPNDAALHTRAKNIMEYINSVFNPFGIYFVAVSGCSFTGCYRGISSNNYSSFRILGNEFEVRMPDGCQPGNAGEKEVKGVELKGNAAGFGFYRNFFFYDGTALPEETLIGTDCIGLGEGMNNVIRENDYSNLHIGNRAMGYNGYALPGDGLVYLCNTSSFSFAPSEPLNLSDYLVTDGSNIRQMQGIKVTEDLSFPTGNIFSGNAVTFKNLGLLVEYHFYKNEPEQDPDLLISFGLNPIPVEQPNGNCPEPPVPPCDPCTTLVELAQLKSHFYQNRQQWLDKKAELPTLTDTAKIRAAKDTILFARLAMNKDGSRILRHYEQDTTLIEIDTILEWLNLVETYPADLLLASHYFFTSDFDTYDILWNQIPGKYDLSDLSLEEFDELEKVYATVRPHLELNGSLHQLPPTITNTLQNWADWCSEPGFLSQRLLWLNGIDVEPDCTGDGIGQRARKQKEEKQNPSLKPFRIYPNPANQMFVIEFTGGLADCKIILYNLQGIPVLNQIVIPITKQLKLPSNHLIPGIYFIEILSASGIVHRSKIIINH